MISLTPDVWTTVGQVFIFLTAVVVYFQQRANNAAIKLASGQAAKDATLLKAAVQEVHLTINSRLTEFKAEMQFANEKLLASEVAAALAKGVTQGKLEEKNATEK